MPAENVQWHPVLHIRYDGTDTTLPVGFASFSIAAALAEFDAAHKAQFDADPAKYLPQYGGYCTNGIVYGIPWGGDADTWKLIDGKLYIFGGQASKDAFELDEKANLALAEKYWNEEVKGRNSFIQRAQRLVFKVPHYKSGEELAQAVAAAKAGKP